MLSLQSLSLIIQEKRIFKNISITLLPSSIVHLTGANGSGKTSLLRIIAGIQNPTTGLITYGKKSTPIHLFSKPYCTYIGHKNGFKAELSVIENLKYWSTLYNSDALIDTAITYFNLIKDANKSLYELSAGNQKKLALAKLIACQSKLWLLDEITTNLDKKNNQLLLNLMLSHANNGGIIIMASHESKELATATNINLADYQ